YEVGLALPEYELDLFGGVMCETDAALQQSLASEEAARPARIALVAVVRESYVSYVGTLLRLALWSLTLFRGVNSFALID
ncbi:multidrug transporter, partial [Pseudomonas aeruginosa]